jgi:flagellar hook assembly protein FlgD
MKRALLLFFVLAPAASAQPVLRVSYTPSSNLATLNWSGSPTSVTWIFKSTHYPVFQPPIQISGSAQWSETLPANSAAVYYIQPMDGNGHSVGPSSNNALVTAASFSDDPLAVGTTVRARHWTELRTAINTARAAAGLAAYTWTNTISLNDPVRAVDLSEMRTAYNAVLSAIQVSGQAFVDPTIDNTVYIKRDHIQQLRTRVRAFPENVGVSGSLSNRYFSPNGDGAKDTTQFSAAVTWAGAYSIPVFRWIINVKSSAGTVLRTAGGLGTSPAFVWDGRNSAGALQPEGDYTIELVDADGTTTPILSSVTTIDLTPPAATITAPADGALLSNVRQNGSTNVSIAGTASDAHFSGWTLSIDSVNSSLATGTSTQVSATWNTSATANGTYTIRLVATDLAGNSATATAVVSVAHFSASQNVYQINTAAGESVTYTSVVPFTVTEVLTIKDINNGNAVVRTLVNGTRGAGTYTDTWNGTNDAGIPLPDRIYRYVVTVTDPATSASMTWDLGTQYYGTQITQVPYPKCFWNNSLLDCNDSSIKFDPFVNQPLKIVYCVGGGTPVSETACTSTTNPTPYVSIVKAAPGPETDTSCGADACIAYNYEASGAHEVTWYGRSVDGSRQLGMSPYYLMAIRRNDIWPKNMTLLYGTAPRITAVSLTPLMFNPAAATPGSQTYQVSLASPTGRAVVISAQFRNTSSMSVLRTITTTASTASQQTFTWNGRADNGDWVAPGLYEVIITATDTAGSASVVRPLTTVRY